MAGTVHGLSSEVRIALHSGSSTCSTAMMMRQNGEIYGVGVGQGKREVQSIAVSPSSNALLFTTF